MLVAGGGRVLFCCWNFQISNTKKRVSKLCASTMYTGAIAALRLHVAMAIQTAKCAQDPVGMGQSKTRKSTGYHQRSRYNLSKNHKRKYCGLI